MKRTTLIVLAPFAAIATMMLGLRIGAGEPVRAARVFGAPFGHPTPGGKTRLAWQLQTFLDERGVKETIPMDNIVVDARSKGKTARWSGATNRDGVAEIAMEMEGLNFGDPLELEVRSASEKSPLAEGLVAWEAVKGAASGSGLDLSAGALGGKRRMLPNGAVRPTARSGPVELNVFIEGDRLVAGFPTSLWVRLDGEPSVSKAAIEIAVEPEAGLIAEKISVTPCSANWAEVSVTAQAHVVGIELIARETSNHGQPMERGRWFGALPVAPGAFFVELPHVIPAAKSSSATLIAPNPRDFAYVEIDDGRGRVMAAALTLFGKGDDSAPRAQFDVPPLSPGLYWIVVSGEPRGAERLTGATIAKAFVVSDSLSQDPNIHAHDTCNVGPWLGRPSAPGFPRWTALDGLSTRDAANRSRRTLGVFIGAVALLTAALLEALLIVGASREARGAIERALREDDPSIARSVTTHSPGGSVAVAVLIGILGLALLAVVLIAKG